MQICSLTNDGSFPGFRRRCWFPRHGGRWSIRWQSMISREKSLQHMAQALGKRERGDFREVSIEGWRTRPQSLREAQR